MRFLQTSLMGLLCVGLLAIAAPASAGPIVHSLGSGPAGGVPTDLTALGTQDWKLINFVDDGDTFTTYNSKDGGFGITLGTGFGTDVSSGIVFTDLRGPDNYTYTDGASNPVSESGLQLDVATGTSVSAYNNTNKTYSITFDALEVGVEHTARVYLSSGRTLWSDISASFGGHVDPVSLSQTVQSLNDVYTVTYTPDTLEDNVTVTFTADSVLTDPGQWRLGITGATLDPFVSSGPTSVSLNFFEDFSAGAPNFIYSTFLEPTGSTLPSPPLNPVWFAESGVLVNAVPFALPVPGENIAPIVSAASVRVSDDLSSTDIAISATFAATSFENSARIGFALFGSGESMDFRVTEAGDTHYVADVQPDGTMRILRIGANNVRTTIVESMTSLTFDAFETYAITVEAKRSGIGGADLDLTFTINDPSEPGLVSITGTDTSPLSGDFFGIRNFTSGNLDTIQAGFDDFRIIESVDGDFDFDADIDGFDFLAWQRGESPNSSSPGDLAIWEAGFGTPSGLLSASVAAVPEPTTSMLLLLGLACTCLLPRSTIMRSQQRKLPLNPQPTTLNTPFSAFRFLLSVLSPVLLITGLLSPTAFAAHPSGSPVPAGYVDAASFGYNSVDATFALQSAINSGQDVFVPNTGADWNVTPIFLTNSNQNILFEDGVVIQAKATHFRGGNDSLFEARDVENVTMTGYGVTLRMNQADYADSTPDFPGFPAAYAAHHQWRHGIDLEHVRNFEIKGFRIEDTGGDAIYVGSEGADAFGGDFSENVLIQDVFIENGYRNGITVASAKDLTIDNVVITGSSGFLPAGGIGFEPNRITQRLENVVVRNTIIHDSFTQGIMFNVFDFDGTPGLPLLTVPITGLIENVTIFANADNAIRQIVPAQPGLTLRNLLLVDNAGVGFRGDTLTPPTGSNSQSIDFSAFSNNTLGTVQGLAEFGPGSFSGIAPVFVSTDPNDPQFLYLDPSTSALITSGASDGGYIGARPVFLGPLSASGSSVPEPSTSLLMLGGLAFGLALRRRRTTLRVVRKALTL